MNPVEKAIRRVDATQRRFTPTAFVFGVLKRFGDDNGGVLVSNLAYSAFVAMFPLLLVLVTMSVIGLIAGLVGLIWGSAGLAQAGGGGAARGRAAPRAARRGGPEVKPRAGAGKRLVPAARPRSRCP